MFIAIKQYERFGQIIPCEDCKHWKDTGNGYGRCQRGARQATGETCKAGDFCSKAQAKEKELYGYDDHTVSGLIDD